MNKQMPLFDGVPTPKPKKPRGPRWTARELERRAQVEAGQCVVANADKTTGDRALVAWAKENGLFVYIGRKIRFHAEYTEDSPYANKYLMDDEGHPWKIRDGDRQQVCAKHARDLRCDPVMLDRARRELPGKVLGCWCYDKQCHGDFWAAIANGKE